MTDRPKRRRYENPPIAEALVQINFAQPLSWTVATPGLYWDAIKADYPADPELQEEIAASVQVGETSPGANFALNRGGQRYVFREAESNRLIVANSTSLSANSLPPYEGWEALKPRFEAAMRALNGVTPLQPIERVSLRYINRIALPAGPLDTDDYFHLNVRTADEGRATFRAFMHRVESVLQDGTLVISTFATMRPTEEESPFLLDLDVQRHNLSVTDIAEVLEIADALKDIENSEFEASIKDKTRGLFN